MTIHGTMSDVRCRERTNLSINVPIVIGRQVITYEFNPSRFYKSLSNVFDDTMIHLGYNSPTLSFIVCSHDQ